MNKSGGRGKAPSEITLLSSDEEQLAWCAERGIQPHEFSGYMDKDCTICGLSIYVAVHWLEEDSSSDNKFNKEVI